MLKHSFNLKFYQDFAMEAEKSGECGSATLVPAPSFYFKDSCKQLAKEEEEEDDKKEVEIFTNKIENLNLNFKYTDLFSAMSFELVELSKKFDDIEDISDSNSIFLAAEAKDEAKDDDKDDGEDKTDDTDDEREDENEEEGVPFLPQQDSNSNSNPNSDSNSESNSNSNPSPTSTPIPTPNLNSNSNHRPTTASPSPSPNSEGRNPGVSDRGRILRLLYNGNRSVPLEKILELFNGQRLRYGGLLFYSIASHINGSRVLQDQIEAMERSSRFSLAEKKRMFGRLKTLISASAIRLTGNCYGNFLVQKFMRSSLLENTKGDFVRSLIADNQGNPRIIAELALNRHGCRVLQTALVGEDSDPSVVDCFLAGFRRDFPECARNINAIHVLQKLIDVAPPGKLGYMVDFFEHNVANSALHKYACRVLQKLWQRCPTEMCRKLYREIVYPSRQCMNLAFDEFGNYVLQTMLFNCQDRFVIDTFIHVVSLNFVHMSSQKFASNVAEKVYSLCTLEQKDYILRRILVDDQGQGLEFMAGNLFGKYVLLTILDDLTGNRTQRHKKIPKKVDSYSYYIESDGIYGNNNDKNSNCRKNRKDYNTKSLRLKFLPFFYNGLNKLEKSPKCQEFGHCVIQYIKQMAMV